MSLYDTLQKTKKELPYRFQRLQAEADVKRSEPVTQTTREVSRDQGIRDSYRQRVEADRNTALASMGNQGVPTGQTLIEKATSGLGQAGTFPQQKSVRQYLGLDPTEQQEQTPKPKSTLELLEQQREENAKKITEGVLPEKQTASFLTWLDSKAGLANRGVTKTIDVVANAIPMLEGAIMGENPDSTLTGQLLKPLTDATGKLDDWTARETENATKLVDETIGDNQALRLVSDIGGGVITALPTAALAMMTGGASAGGTIGSQLAPQASGLAATVSSAWQKLISNPMFQTSFIQSLGSGYEEAKEAGASDVNAMAAALLSTTANSIVEVGGGVETLPGELKNADLSTGKKALQWLTSALDEGKEEVVQGAISNMVNKAASGSDTPYFSMTDENAVVNPLRMAQEFGMGTAVGGILGGGQVLADSMLQKAANRSGNVQDEATPSQALPDSPLAEGAQGDGMGKLDAAIQETLKPTQELENLNNAIDGLFAQNKTAQADTGAESTNVNTNPAIHTPQEQAMEKGSTDQVLDMPKTASSLTSETSHGAYTPNFNVAQSEPSVNGNTDQSDVMDHGSVGAAESGFSPYSHYQNQTSDFLPEGANAARPVDMPAVDPTGKPVRRGAKTIYGAQTTSDARAEQMENEFMEGMYGYDPVRDKPTLEKAKQTIAQEGYDRAYSRVTERLQSMKKLKETGLEAYLLYADAVKNGNDADAAELCLLLTQSGTEFGQGVQLFSMFRKLSPEGQLMGVERFVQRINDKYGDSKKLNGHPISIDENLISEFRNAQDQDTRDAVMEKIYENIGKQIPTTFSEAINQWRYTAMLLNPSTHIKNMGGNLSMMAMKLGKDAIGTGIEAAANKITGGKVGRTKSILNVFNKSDQALMQKAWSDFENVQDDVAGIGKNKDNVMGKIGEYRDYWKLNDPQGNAARLVDGVLRTAEKVPKFNSAMMNKEDMIFSRPDYAISLAGYMKANKLTEITPEARAYAIKEAQKATFRDANAVSNFARKMGTGDNKFWNFLINSIFPFKGTPANVGVRAVEYSPAGLLKALTYDIYRVKTGKISATEYIDNLASGLTGSALSVVGYFLAQAGFLRATGVGDEKEKEQQRQQGYKDNSFTLFGHSIPEKVLTSISAPLFVGAAFYESLATKALTGEIYGWDEVLQVLAATADPILGQTMLDGLSDTFYTIRSAQGGMGEVTAALLANTAGNYLSSLMPTILSRISSASDSVGRETYADKNKQLAGIQKEVQGLMMKTPARQMLHEKVDNYGRVQETWNPFGDDNAAEKSLNFLTNVVTPTYPSKIKDTPVENELNRLYQSGADTSDKKIFQTEAAKSFKVDGKTVNLTADQHEEFEKIRGENTIEYQGALQDSEQYNNLDDSLKIYATDKMYDFIEQTSKDLLGIGYDPADWVAELNGKSPEEIADAVIKETIDSYAQSDNFSGKYDGITSMLDSGTIDEAMAVSLLPKEANDGYYKHIKGSGIELSAFIDVYQFKNNAKSDKDKDGKTTKSAQEKVIEYINKVGRGPGQKRRMFLAMGYSEKNLPEEWK